MFEIPPVVLEKARAVGAEAWIDELPAFVSAIEAEWRISVGQPYRDSTEAFVAQATRSCRLQFAAAVTASPDTASAMARSLSTCG